MEGSIRFRKGILVMVEQGHANGLSNAYSVAESLPRPDEGEVYAPNAGF